MGICQSQQQRSSKFIDNQIIKDHKKNSLKLLILGPGESGKSTVLKQMRLLHGNGFTKEELEARKGILYSNIVSQMVVIINAMKALRIHLEDAEKLEAARLLLGVVEAGKEMQPLTEEVTSAVRLLWAAESVQQCYRRRVEYQLNDSAKYFIESVGRISAHDYTPSELDMLYSRVATTGVVDIRFTVDNIEFKVFDVGGQRSERKKWIHCFDDVNAVLYVTAISEYDQRLREDNMTNRMSESLALFDSITNSAYFARSSMILFLNKTDLFIEKLDNVPLQVCFPEYNGESSYTPAIDYITHQFHMQRTARRSTTDVLYVHETCATDSDQAQRAVASVIDTVVENSLKSAGMM